MHLVSFDGKKKTQLWIRLILSMLTLLVVTVGWLANTPRHVSAAGTTRYVTQDGTDSGNCDSNINPCATIDYAHDRAQSGDEIKVAAGLYQEAEIMLSKSITITGGFHVILGNSYEWNTSTYTLTPTILDGENTHRVIQINNATHLALQNLVIQAGQADLSPEAADNGGGILIRNSDEITLIGLELKANQASTSNANSYGGAIAILNFGDILIQRAYFLANSTPGFGGAIATRASTGEINLTVESTVIAQNQATSGGAVATSGNNESNIFFRYVTIADNDRGNADDAIFMNSTSNAANRISFSGSILSGNLIGVHSMDTTVPIYSGTLLFDLGVTTPYSGNLFALTPVFGSLLYEDPTNGNYQHAIPSSAIDIDKTLIKVDVLGSVWTSPDDCTPRALCPYGRLADYGAYEYVYGVEPTIRYVATVGNDNTSFFSNCLSSIQPCASLRQATYGAIGGDEIRVAQGAYMSPFFGLIPVFDMFDAYTITGGYTLTNWITLPENIDPILTVIDGGQVHNVVSIAYDGSGGMIQNVTIRNGKPANARGGGIHIDGAINTQINAIVADFTLRNCVVENNESQAITGGGGLLAINPLNLRVEGCRFSGNRATQGAGGGLAIWDISGDGTYTLTDLVIHNNLADRTGPPGAYYGGLGGGLYLEGKGRLEKSEIYENAAKISGGGIAVGDNAEPTMDRVIIRDNEAGVGGGFSIYVTGGATLQNSLLVSNHATSIVPLEAVPNLEAVFGGNAIHSPYTGSGDRPLRLINLTIANNTGAVPEAIKIEGSGIQRDNQLINVLISGSEVGIRSDGLGEAEIQKVFIADDVATATAGFGVGDLTGTFLTGPASYLGANDFRLQPTAPAVDVGELVLGLDFALGDTPRIIGAATDIGAYETSTQQQIQSINFAPLPNRAQADSPFTVQATATSGLEVTFTSLTPNVCTVNGATVTLLTEGTCSIQANQSGNALFNAASPVTRTFEIGIIKPQETLHLPALERQ